MAPATTVVHLADVCDPANLAAMVAGGYVAVRRHPSAPLRIYDYTARAQYRRVWNRETLACRGLVVDAGDRVAARPFPKFFHLGEHAAGLAPAPLPPEGAPFEAFEKLDGALGVLYRLDGEPAIATRGSFASRAARWASAHYRARYAGVAVPEGVTYLFEILCAESRMVVDYGDREDLVLLAVLDNATGADRPLPPDWPGPVARRLDGAGDLASLEGRVAGTTTGDHEGFVARFCAPPGEPSLRVKVKSAAYVRRHRLYTGVTAKAIWERLSSGQDPDDLARGTSEEFRAWVRGEADGLRAAYRAVEEAARAGLADLRVDPADRRAAAGALRAHPHAAVAFKMLDGRPYADLVWRAVRPGGAGAARSFRADPDA